MARERWIGVESAAEWQGALRDVPHAFAHTWEYCRAMQKHSGRPTFLYEVETGGGRFVCPVQERHFDGTTDIVTPPGFSGFTGVGDARGVRELWLETAGRRGYVCGYLVPNPALPDPAVFPRHDAHGCKSIYVFDLTRPLGELHRHLHANRKRQLRRWDTLAAGIVTDRGRLSSFLLDNYESFYAGKGAESAYGLSRTSLTALADLDNVVMFGAGDDGHVGIAAVFAHTSSGGDYLFAISRPEARRYSAALVWAAVLYLKSLGVPHLNLGGGLEEGDGVAAFKQRFGTTAIPLHVVRQVYDRPKYEELCRRTGVDPRAQDGYFPAYRRASAATRRSSRRDSDAS